MAHIEPGLSMKNSRLFAAALLLLLHAAAHADSFEIYCKELSAGPDQNLPSPYKAVWNGGKLMQMAVDSNGKISESSEAVVATKRLSAPDSKGLNYSFVTRIQEPGKNRFLTNISAEPTNAADDFIVSVSYATVDRDGFLIYAFEVVNQKCTVTTDAGGAAPASVAAPAAPVSPPPP
jgi:hypothetical protein